jgi:hypothetical protein
MNLLSLYNNFTITFRENMAPNLPIAVPNPEVIDPEDFGYKIYTALKDYISNYANDVDGTGLFYFPLPIFFLESSTQLKCDFFNSLVEVLMGKCGFAKPSLRPEVGNRQFAFVKGNPRVVVPSEDWANHCTEIIIHE